MAQTNNIALIFDFDYTLTEKISEQPIFDYYHCKADNFWDACDIEYEKRIKTLKKLKQVGIFDAEATLCRETIYADVLVNFVQKGRFPKLTLKRLYELGNEIIFHPGVPEFMPEMKNFVESEEKWKEHNISLEFYVISCGIEEMIKGSKIAPYLTGLFATKFSENEKGLDKVIHAISYNEKTKFIYKINKGPEFNENDYVPEDMRRIAKGSFIYVGDGKSDVPCFKATMKDMKGKVFGVYGKKRKYFEEAYNLEKQNRVMAIGSVDYREDSHTIKYLEQMIKEIADNKVEEIEEKISRVIVLHPKP